jgi:DNA-binding response OmpR family regulator
MKLLLVDDEENILAGMRRYFRAQGYDVDCASEREEAQALASHVPYDAVIVDLCLTLGHGPDGLEVVHWIHERCPAARILVLTAFGSPETLREALRLGADTCLQKPRSMEEVHGEVRRLLAPTQAS